MVINRIIDDILDAWRQYNQKGWLFSLGIVMYYVAGRIIKKMLRNASQRKYGESRLQNQKDRERHVGHRAVKCLFQVLLVWSFAVYSYFVINLTLLSRETDSRGTVNLLLFSFLNGENIKKAEALENILMLFPCGIMLPALSRRFRDPGPGLAAGFFVSLLIETVQLFTGCGYFELDDIILNGLGAAAGYIVFRIALSMFQKKVTR